jgi:dihydrofolate reductase
MAAGLIGRDMTEEGAMMRNNSAYRAAAAVAVGTGLFLVWGMAALGVVGVEGDSADLMFFGVLAIGIGGAIVARFEPDGMARAMLATAGATVSVGVIDSRQARGGVQLGVRNHGPDRDVRQPFRRVGVVVPLCCGAAEPDRLSNPTLICRPPSGADLDDDIGPLFEWYFNGDVSITDPGEFKVSQASAEYIRPTWASIGSMVVGRHLFDMMNGWEGIPPAGDHVVVVSHPPKPNGWPPEASYYFVDDLTEAIAKAKELAGDRTVAVAAGDVGGQALALGLVDEVAMDVVPVVFGSGKPFFGHVDSQHLLEDPDVVIRGDRVLHLRYRVRR